jgi:Skp family chaperone for outer membrane proteins
MSMLADDARTPMPPRPAMRPAAEMNRSRRLMVQTLRPAADEAGDDPRQSLESLRAILVGPAMQINDARLNELVAIMEERETSFNEALRALEDRTNAAREQLEARLRTAEEQFTARLETAIHALAETAAKQHAELRTEIRDGLNTASQHNRALAGHLDYAAARLETQIEDRAAAINAELNEKTENLSHRIVENRKAVMAELGRAIGSLATAVGGASEETDSAG